jgi:uncharacterized protein YjiS (DUF1127 family)
MTISLAETQAARRPLWAAGALLQLPVLWLLRASWRNELAALDAAQMRDCGLNPREVHREATKPFWRP